VDLGDSGSTITFLCGLAIAVGIIGVIVPVLPGLLLCWGGVLAWALLTDRGWGKWVVLTLVTAIAVAGTVAKYAWPGRSLKRRGVPTTSLVFGGLLGIIGFFVIPVVGLFLGFILGVFAAERLRLGDSRLAWPSTKHALKAAGLSMLIELFAAFLIAFVWVVGLFVS
jgi:uncharacterized protein YqgC (DUF456 family)